MTETADGAIALDIDDTTAIVRIERAEHRNAMTRALVMELVRAFDRVDADDKVRAVIVTGSGTSFSVGADLSGGGKTFRGGRTERSAGERDVGGILALRIFACTKPVIAAINGDAVGIGATMTLPMDVRLAADSARFAFPFVRRGIVAETCSSWFLPRIVGISRALEWMMSGALVSAAEAQLAGLVRECHPPEQLLPAAMEIAHRLTSKSSPLSVAATRRLLWNGLTTAHPMEAHRQESVVLGILANGPDATEGITSFLERREARFVSRPSHDLEQFAHLWPEPAYERPDSYAAPDSTG
jgi:enoyl-CoA hydratase/carnithine racemase